MKKTLLSGAMALSMGVASNASAIAFSITAMNFGSTSAASGIVDTDNLGTTFNGTFFSTPWTATTQIAFTASGTWAGTSPHGSFSYNFNLSAGQVAFGAFFDWSCCRVPIIAIFNADGSAGPGVPMQVGPFPGQAPSWQGTVPTAVPIPAAVWLFGSGLIGLAGFARRKKA